MEELPPLRNTEVQDLADKFPKKTDEVLGGNRLRSSIVMEC